MKSSVRILLLFAMFLAGTARGDDLTLSFGGDLGLASGGLNSTATEANADGTWIPIADLIGGIRGLWDADLNFANLETVVTDRPLPPFPGKTYVFRTHPEALAPLIAGGLNLFSTANNHAYDFDAAGIEQTVQHTSELCAGGACHVAGAARDLAGALSVEVFEVRGYRIAFAAIGILSENDPRHRAGAGKPGTASYRDLSSDTRAGADYGSLLRQLRAARADLKILSVHFGTEGRTELDPGQRADFQRAFTEGDADVVIGHHAHVVRPWEIVSAGGRPRVVFYGLGNYLHLGTSDIARRRDGRRDFGLYGKLYFSFNPLSRRLESQALKLTALTETHLRAHPIDREGNAKRLELLNQANRASFGDQAAIVDTAPRGYGRACFGKLPGPAAGALCR